MLADPSWPSSDHLQQIERNPEAVARFVYLLEPTLRAAGIAPARWEPFVTWTRKVNPIDWHFDKELGQSRHKLYVYLNNAPGTVFDRTRRYEVKGEAGTLVIFPINLEHRGVANPDRVLKQLIGLRPVI